MNFQLYSTMEIWTVYLVGVGRCSWKWSWCHSVLGNWEMVGFTSFEFESSSIVAENSHAHSFMMNRFYMSIQVWAVLKLYISFFLAKGWSPKGGDQSLGGKGLGSQGFTPPTSPLAPCFIASDKCVFIESSPFGMLAWCGQEMSNTKEVTRKPLAGWEKSLCTADSGTIQTDV